MASQFAQSRYDQRQRPQDALTQYFMTLPNDTKLAETFRPRWMSLAHFRPGDLSARESVIVLDGTRLAWMADHGRMLGQDFPARLQPEMKLWYAHAKAQLPHYRDRDIECALTDHADLGIMPDGAFMNSWYTRANASIGNARRHILTHMMRAFSVLGRVPRDDFKSAWMKAVFTRMDEFGPGLDTQGPRGRLKSAPSERSADLAETLWALAVQDCLDARHRAQHQLLAEKLMAQASRYRLDSWTSQAQCAQIYDACLWFDIPNPVPRPDRRGNCTSSLESDLRKIFDQASLKVLPGDQAALPRLGKRVDFAVKTLYGTLHVEADGPTHFTVHADGSTHYNGKTVFQSELMSRIYPQMTFVRVPYTTINHPDAFRPADLRRSFETLSARRAPRAPGPFMVGVKKGQLDLRPVRA